MNEISDVDIDDEDVFGYLAERSHKKQAAAEINDDRTPEVSCDLSLGIPRDLIHKLECR